MIKVGVIENYVVKLAKGQGVEDYVVIAEVSPKSPFEKKVFGDAKKVRFMIPQYGTAIYDSTLNMRYNLLVTLDDEIDYTRETVDYVQAIPVPKSLENEKDVSSGEPCEMPTIVDKSNIKTDYKILKSKNGAAYSAVSDDSVYMRAGNSKLVLGANGISMYGEVIQMGMPTENHVLLKETGMMRMMPKCFIPPFALPDYMPNVDLLVQVSEIGKSIRKLKDIL